MTPLTSQQAAAIDTPHVVHGVDSAGAYLGLVSAAAAATIAACPPPTVGTWRWLVGRWLRVFGMPELRLTKWSEIKAARDAAIAADLQTPFGAFQCGRDDRASITDAMLLLQTLEARSQPTTITFTLADNSVVALTAAQTATVSVLIGQRTQAAHATGRSLRAQIADAQTPQALAAIAWA